MQDKKELQGKDFQKTSGDVRKDVSSQAGQGLQAASEKLPGQQGQQKIGQEQLKGQDTLRQGMDQGSDTIRKGLSDTGQSVRKDVDQGAGVARQAMSDVDQKARKGLGDVDTDENLRRGSNIPNTGGGLQGPGTDNKGSFRK